jgi:hypothetical protein
MSLSDTGSIIINSLIPAAPYLAAWIAAIVFSVIMFRRGGGRAERFLLTGSCLMLASRLLSVPTVLIVPLLVDSGWSTDRALPVLSGVGLFLGLVGLAGIVCLVYAFWVKFEVKSNVFT